MEFKIRHDFVARLRRYFLSGLLVWLPILATVVVIKFLIDILDSTLLLLPEKYRPDALLGFHLPGIGVILTLGVIILTGFIAANVIGKQLVSLWDSLLARIPLVRTIHAGVKQILETIISTDSASFRKVLLIEFPYTGMWTLAFQTGDGTSEVEKNLEKKSLVTLFVPMTPNITSGFVLILPRDKVVELDMSIDQALKFIISLGVMQPEKNRNNQLKQKEDMI